MSTTNNNPSWTRATIEPHRGLPFRVKDALHKSIGSFPRWWAVAVLSWECIKLWRQPFHKKRPVYHTDGLCYANIPFLIKTLFPKSGDCVL